MVAQVETRWDATASQPEEIAAMKEELAAVKKQTAKGAKTRAEQAISLDALRAGQHYFGKYYLRMHYLRPALHLANTT